ncbi:MAG: hypothetical protein R3E68_13680 [Burkholderiaceae bacterium]
MRVGSAAAIRGVDLRRPTPAWIRDRLSERASGRSRRCRHLNYVMLELGRPVPRVRSRSNRWRPGRALGPRRSRSNCSTARTVSLNPQFGVIVDAQSVESLAGGIMGRRRHCVDDDTVTNIYVEARPGGPMQWSGALRSEFRPMLHR